MLASMAGSGFVLGTKEQEQGFIRTVTLPASSRVQVSRGNSADDIGVGVSFHDCLRESRKRVT